jgi:hypothetical protein
MKRNGEARHRQVRLRTGGGVGAGDWVLQSWCPTGKAVHLPASRALTVGGRSIVLPPHKRRAPWPVPPCLHVTLPKHRCHRAHAPPRSSAASSSRRCCAAPPHPSTRRRKRLRRASRWRKKEDAERPRGEEKKKEGRGKKKYGEREKGKITYLIFLEIVIHNLYLLSYYRVMKIEDVSYKQI